MRGIDAAGVYLPRFRLPTEETAAAWGHADAGGIDQKAVPAADEDTLTMAVAAAERALENAAVDRSAIDLVAAATTTPPMAEGDFLSRFVRMVALPNDAAGSISTQHTAAGGEALARALDTDGPALVVAADCPEGDPADADHPLGAGAAAFVVDDNATVPVRDVAWHNDETPGIRFRPRGEREVASLDITTYERTAVREAVTEAVSALAGDTTEATAAALHQRDGKFPYRVAGDLPLSNEAVAIGTVVDRIGDAGVATVPIGLLVALSEASEGGMTIGGFFGGGSAVAFSLEGSLPVRGIDDLEAGESIEYTAYLRKRGYVVDSEVAGGGANVSLPNWQKSLDQRYRLVAGQCPNCGGVTFPPRGACQECHSRVEFERIEAARDGVIEALTVIGQGGAPPEFAELQKREGAYAVAIVALEAGDGEATLPAQLADVDPEAVVVGDEVRTTIRQIYAQEGVPRYGVKFKPTG
ncbi:zinc ribbon domain-containing protein [Halalkalicoccus subterraneus]|uniref:zinc ribbon domain-containing protein n=1 Tax=Halalkalicoccus subterraneus TaxID=2675002 RepID=UPI000EFCF55B|nr:zinc ribbon domain-containing protein [Halalkalicoccus subterraneus]